MKIDPCVRLSVQFFVTQKINVFCFLYLSEDEDTFLGVTKKNKSDQLQFSARAESERFPFGSFIKSLF